MSFVKPLPKFAQMTLGRMFRYIKQPNNMSSQPNTESYKRSSTVVKYNDSVGSADQKIAYSTRLVLTFTIVDHL